MHMSTIRLTRSRLLSLLLCVQAPAQAPATSRTQGPMVRPDPKRAQKAVERGDKAQAAGNLDEALLAYKEAARYAPQEGYFLDPGPPPRSRLLLSYTQAAQPHPPP